MYHFLILLFSFSLYAISYSKYEDSAYFSGRISKLNKDAKLMRLRISFENAKFFRKKDKVEFWNESYPSKKCLAYIEGRTPDYLLLKIPTYKNCILNTYLTTGSYLHLYSEDLEKGLEIAKSLVEILLKKKVALQSRMKRFKNNVDGHIEKVEAINQRYETLRQKLELEWKAELSLLEVDKVKNYQAFKDSQARLNDLHYKLEQYRVFDQNLKEERWSLDKKLYFKK